ncbi:MAG: hypothetical protein GVX96_04890 [Bacteroidetes bacterium]|jgi:hypothetical protein|nr:hypothetical protein [Bacteroidota bacterium]
MRIFVLASICFLLLSACVEVEKQEFTLFPEFEEEPVHGPLSQYLTDQIDIGISERILNVGSYKGDKKIRILQGTENMVAVDPDDYSILWTRSREGLGSHKAFIYDYKNELLVGYGNQLTRINSSTGETIEELSLWEEGEDRGEIAAMRVINDRIYTLNFDYAQDSMYHFQLFEHRIDQKEREILFSLAQKENFKFYSRYISVGTKIPQEIGYDREKNQLIFPLFVHDHSEYDYGPHAFAVDLRTGEVNNEPIPVRFPEVFRQDKRISYRNGQLSFWTTHLNVYSAEEKRMIWENIGGSEQYLNNHVLQITDEKANVYAIPSGEMLWTTEFPDVWARQSSGVNADETLLFFPRRDRLSVYDLESGQLMVDFFSEAMDSRRFFFDEQNRLVMADDKGTLFLYTLDF